MSSSVLPFVEHAMQRTARLVEHDLARGVASLSAITVLAPWLSLAMVPTGIIGSFVGCAGERSMCMAVFVDNLANGITRCVPGLFVGILALMFHRYLSTQLRALEVDLRAGTLDLLNLLSRTHPGR